MWMDTHSMVALGFGFLYTLLRRYGWSGVSLNFIIAAFCIQWALLCNGARRALRREARRP